MSIKENIKILFVADLSFSEKQELEEFFHRGNWFASQEDLAELFAGYKLNQYNLDPVILNYREPSFPPTKKKLS